MEKQLSPRRLAFVNAYAKNGGNGRLAAQEAGFKGSANALAVQASRLLRDANVLAALAKPLEEAGITPEAVTRRLAQLVHAEPEDEFKHDHLLKAMALAMKANGMLKEVKRPTNVIGTMQFFQLQQQMKKMEEGYFEGRKGPSIEVETIEGRDENGERFLEILPKVWKEESSDQPLPSS